ncbi:Mannosyltransferase [Meloidogyne graminicola]|uniref:Mannosyltransferase n=1 Tax=Meloidogyne graminicola TaxID=189291 RepID=A0A8S9ZZK3_9BILA|nr:Mannosyltransferase [Meloidogyne graminicola]
MGKLPKNFALLKRRENQRISRRRLQESSSISSNSPAENERIELSTSDFNWKDQDWAPSLSAVFKILFSIRLSASLWSIISDCDEVYNYWEPLHLVLFKRGFQTWEYSPIYAIRSWLYILLYAAPAKFFMLFFYESKVPLFFSIRFFISLFTLFSELFLYRAICQRISNSIGRTFILFSMFSNAMFGASCAFLPSSFSMERFLFPIYPYICLLSAFSLDFLYKILNNTKTQFANIFYITILFIFIITSFSRIAALHRNYSGLLDTYKEFNNKINTFEDLMLKVENNSTKIPLLRLCIGKEWHRFPSSFFLPENRKNNRGVEMRFIKSEFRALLPDIFPKGLTVAEITQQVPIHQNDENREQMERYVPLNSCNFLIDLAGMEPTEFEPDYSKMVSSIKFNQLKLEKLMYIQHSS